MPRPTYSDSVFINCPFDSQYSPLLNTIIFTVFDCGFVPRCALEESDSGVIRIDKLFRLIKSSKFAIHDISRTELNSRNALPRFNMSFELGIFLGAKEYGDSAQRKKICLVIDKHRHQYQKSISDISGQDIKAHNDNPKKIMKAVRDWLNCHHKSSLPLPGAEAIWQRYAVFQAELPQMCRALRLKLRSLTYVDYIFLVSEWLRQAAP